MRIIVDFIPLKKGSVEGWSGLIINALRQIVQEQPGHEWFLLSQKKDKQQGWPVRNVRHLYTSKSWPGQLGWKIMYDRQIPGLIKKHHADLFISVGGITCSSPVTQVICISGTTEMHHLAAARFSSFYKKNLDKSIAQSKSIFTFSAENKNEIITEHQQANKKIQIIYAAPADEIQPPSWPEKESIKIKYTGGKEYFLVTGSPGVEKLLDVLKAFSQFKKRQQSNMQLVVAVKDILWDAIFAEKLENYKYRSDVHIPGTMTENERQKIVSAAYAMVYCAEKGDPGSAVLDAFKAGVPVIAETGSCPPEIGGEALLYVEKNNLTAMAEALMLLYKDENLRNEHIEKGKPQAAFFNTEKTAQAIWKGILDTVNK